MIKHVKDKKFILITLLLIIASLYMWYEGIYRFDKQDFIEQKVTNFTMQCAKSNNSSNARTLWFESSSTGKISTVGKIENCFIYEKSNFDYAVVTYAHKIIYNLVLDNKVVVSKNEVHSDAKFVIPFFILFMFCIAYGVYFGMKESVEGWKLIIRKLLKIIGMKK